MTYFVLSFKEMQPYSGHGGFEWKQRSPFSFLQKCEGVFLDYGTKQSAMDDRPIRPKNAPVFLTTWILCTGRDPSTQNIR